MDPRHTRYTLVALSVLAMVALGLCFIHPLFAWLTLPFTAFCSLTLCEFLSRRWFGKRFDPPTRFGSPSEDYRTEWSDWLLFLPFVVLMFLGLSVLGEVGDCLGGRDVWHSSWPLCSGLPK
jgi:hypothetical protein